MLTNADLRRLNQAYQAVDVGTHEKLLRELGTPDDAAIIAAAEAGMADEDRNVRVLMLRLLTHYPTEAALPALLQGLEDEERRVQEAAVRSAKSFLSFPAVTDRLATMITHSTARPKLRTLALDTLTGVTGGEPVAQLPSAAVLALSRLAQRSDLQSEILPRLLRLELTPELERLLHSLAATLPPDEAAMAGKALAGEKVINLGQIADPAERRRVSRECEPAFGRVYFWVPRSRVAVP